MAEQRRLNPLLASLSVLLVATWLGLPFLRVAPNRLVSGQPVYLSSILQGVSWLLLCLALAGLFVAALMAAYRWSRWWCVLVLVLSSALIPGSLWWAANHASALAHGGMVMTRTSFGSGFWIGLVLLTFLATTGLQQLKARPVLRLTVGLALLISVSAMVVSGAMGELSLFREYGQRKDDFSALLARHVEIVGLTFLFTVCIGLPLGWLAHAQAKVGRALLPVLNLVQTIPSIALFGLLMAPLAWLATSVPALGLAGISGVGLAPALIALTLYGLLPVVRGVLEDRRLLVVGKVVIQVA